MSGSGEFRAPVEEAGAAQTIEETADFAPRWDATGVVPVIASDAVSGEVLMLAYMNAEALALTLQTGLAHYWSRSRARIWKKGEESGNLQRVVEMRTDCDQDALWITVEVAGAGASCHTGRRSCFYRAVTADGGSVRLTQVSAERMFDPAVVYAGRRD